MPFRFEFDALRATQAAALLIQHAGGRLNYTRLIKLMYLADRESLRDTGSSITGAKLVLMTYGPVLSEVYDCVRHPDDCPAWSRHITRSGRYDIQLDANPGDSELSDFDVELLSRIHAEHKNHSLHRLLEIIHDLPECKSPGKGKSQPLYPSDILHAVNVDDVTIAEYEQRNQYTMGVRWLLERRA